MTGFNSEGGLNGSHFSYKDVEDRKHFRDIFPVQQILLAFSGVRANAMLYHIDLSRVINVPEIGQQHYPGSSA